MPGKMHLSIVVPLFNEEDSVGPLLEQLVAFGKSLTCTWELLLVDDGSHVHRVDPLPTGPPAEGGRFGYHYGVPRALLKSRRNALALDTGKRVVDLPRSAAH